MKSIVIFIMAAATLSVVGCAGVSRPVSLGAGGAALGAGAGAIVGSIISNGDIGMSAALGAGIGAAAGIATGFIADQMEQAEVRRIDREIHMSQLEIDARQKEIDATYQRLMDGSQRGEPSEDNYQPVYDGPTMGNYYR